MSKHWRQQGMCQIIYLGLVGTVRYCFKVRSPGGCVFLPFSFACITTPSSIPKSKTQLLREWTREWRDEWVTVEIHLRVTAMWPRWSAREHRLGPMWTRALNDALQIASSPRDNDWSRRCLLCVSKLSLGKYKLTNFHANPTSFF